MDNHEKSTDPRVSIFDQASGIDGVPNPARRRFSRAGLGASGVILTLACKPVLGGVVSKAPSGFLSANQSTHGEAAARLSSARRPEYWQTATNWPIPQKTKFSNIFHGNNSSPFAHFTLEEMISAQASDTERLGMFLTAAMLNSRSGWTPFLTEETIQSMYVEWRSVGYFSPTANVRWVAGDIVNYLQATQV